MNSTEYSEESLPKKKAKNDYLNNLQPISSNPHNFIQINLTENLLTKPACIGEFSLDKSRLPSLGRSQARYFYEASLGNCNKTKISTKLTQGFDKFKKEEKEDEGLLVLMRWILAVSVPNSSLKKSIHESDFIVWRGTITRLMFSCYDNGPNSVGVKVACCKFKGVYFIRELNTKTKIKNENSKTDYEEKMCFAGHKFEQIVTVEDLNMKPNTSQNVDLNSEFVGIFKATLNPPSNLLNSSNLDKFNLFYGAEIDCISSNGQHLEIKTQYKNIGFGKGFPNKALKWWIQSYLASIKQLVIGLHENLQLNRVELIEVNSLFKYFSRENLNSACCFAFLYSFLQTIKSYLDKGMEEDILVAERLPNSNEFNFQLFEKGSEMANNYCVLTEEFKNHCWR